jgi:hypothetical protein
MATLFSFGIKQPDGTYKNYTGSISDKVTASGMNVSVYEEQTKEERVAQKPKTYLGSGKVFWSDGKVTVARFAEVEEPVAKKTKKAKVSDEDDSLPF